MYTNFNAGLIYGILQQQPFLLSNPDAPLPSSGPVSDGLVCWLDGRDITNESEIWTDRSGFFNQFSINGAPIATGTSCRCSSAIISNSSISMGPGADITLEMYITSDETVNSVVCETSATTAGIHIFAWDSPAWNESVKYKIVAGCGNTRFGTNKTDALHIAVVRSSGVVNVYYDAVCVGTTDNSYPFTSPRIGNRNGSYAATNTYIHSLRIYGRALSLSEISDNYKFERTINRSLEII